MRPSPLPLARLEAPQVPCKRISSRGEGDLQEAPALAAGKGSPTDPSRETTHMTADLGDQSQTQGRGGKDSAREGHCCVNKPGAAPLGPVRERAIGSPRSAAAELHRAPGSAKQALPEPTAASRESAGSRRGAEITAPGS